MPPIVKSISFGLVLTTYALLTVWYSLQIKRVVLLDVFVLSSFYTFRIWAGGLISGTVLSQWFLAFWLVQVIGSVTVVAAIVGTLAVPAGLVTWVRAQHRSSEGRPMTGLQLTASVVFLAVLLPAMLLTSLVAALFLVCMATGPPSFH